MSSLEPLAMISSGKLSMAFCQDGSIQSIHLGSLLLTRYIKHSIDRDLCVAWLRRHHEDGMIESSPITRLDASLASNAARFKSTALGIAVDEEYILADEGWKYTVSLGPAEGSYDLVFLTAPGFGTEGFVLENELYASQYMDHSVFHGPWGAVITSRQNLDQDGAFPLFQSQLHGIKAVGFSTDECQLRKGSRNILDLSMAHLDDKVFQGESALHALQSDTFTLDKATSVSMICIASPSNQDRVRKPLDPSRLIDVQPQGDWKPKELHPAKALGPDIEGRDPRDEDLRKGFEGVKFEEVSDSRLLSFFAKRHVHVVTKAKEEASARGTGTILMSGGDLTDFRHPRISTTTGMDGLFSSHVVIGNTNHNKFVSSNRGQYSDRPSLGMRIYLEDKGAYRRLATPSFYEMGPGHSRWTYLLDDEVIRVSCHVAASSPALRVSVDSDREHRFLVTMLLSFGKHENKDSFDITKQAYGFTVEASGDNPAAKTTDCPAYEVRTSGGFSFHDDSILLDGLTVENPDLVCLESKATMAFQIVIGAKDVEIGPEEEERPLLEKQYDEVLASLEIKGASQDAAILDETLHSYAHNTLVHYLMPHGLEQQGGAAWGTRDVSQGPFEFLMTFGHHDAVRKILLNVFAHQRTSGEWPQWFMFDSYKDAYGSCHGDVIFWPLKCLSLYITATGDVTILDEPAAFLDQDREEPIITHVCKALSSIEGRFIDDTWLVSYGGGDWDDTLQPMDSTMKDDLVSSWTQALAYEVITGLAKATEGRKLPYDLASWAEGMRKNFHTYLVKDGCIAGFLLYSKGKLMLHPDDDVTGIHYRLISLTRAVIAGLVSQEEALSIMDLIEKELHYADGVHLMDRPAPYDGGLSKLFVRAERAANIGREISLEYIHADIRHIMAAVKAGRADLAWKGLMEINPILLSGRVPNALPRQANMYFSSSDGLFSDRYEYSRDFDKLKDGTIPVAGGWRLYSSGPGIYITALVRDVLGLDMGKEHLTISPCISASALPLSVSFVHEGRRIRVDYVASDADGIELDGVDASPVLPWERLRDGSVLTARLRTGGVGK